MFYDYFLLHSSDEFRQEQITEFIDSGIYNYSVEKWLMPLFYLYLLLVTWCISTHNLLSMNSTSSINIYSTATNRTNNSKCSFL